MATKNVAVVVGSLRRESFNRKMAKALIELAPSSLKLEIVEIGELPHYNQDEDEAGRIPAAWFAFRQRIKAADAVIFVTPEYNRSVPGVLKNAIDVASRPYGQSVWDRKPAGIISVSPGAIGGFGANHHLRAVARVPQHAGHAAAGGLHRQCGAVVRRHRQAHKREHARFSAEVSGSLCRLGRGERLGAQ